MRNAGILKHQWRTRYSFCFVTKRNDWKPLIIITKSSILDAASVVDPSLSLYSQMNTKGCKCYASISLTAHFFQSEYRKIRTRKNSLFGHFSRSGGGEGFWTLSV